MISVLHYLSGLADIKAGIETYIINLYDNLDKSRFRFAILTRNAQRGSKLNEILAEKGIQVYDLEIHNLGIRTMGAYVDRLNHFFEAHRGEFDFLHMHGYDDPFVVGTAKRWGVGRAAVHVHQLARESAPGISEVFKRGFSRDNIRRANHLFACSEEAGAAMYGGAKFTVLKNSIDTQRFRFDPEKRAAKRKELRLGAGEIAIAYTGRLVAVKNLGFLLDVFACLWKMNRPVVLFMAGKGEEEQALRRKVKELGIEERVHFLGERNDIDLLLQGMDLYLQTSLHEGFSFSVLEAQCCGLPAVISDGFPDDIKVTNLVHRIPLKESKEAWASRIAEVLDSCADQLSRRGEYAAVIESSGYDSRRTAAAMAMIYSGELAE